jgi:hypothetical protein
MQNGCIPKANLDLTEGKPVVYYTGAPRFANWFDNPEQPVAYLEYVIGHPALGNCSNVRTSTVLKVLFDATIVTRNTVYKPVQEQMGS